MRSEEFKFADASSAIYSFFWHEFCDWYIELVKKRLLGDDEESKRAAQSTLVAVLDEALRLLHPMMPFITEELWQKLPIERERKTIMLASYPESIARFADETIEQEYALVKDAITAIRTIKAESNVSPGKRVDATFICMRKETEQMLGAHESEIINLAKLNSLTIQDKDAPRPDQAGVKVMEHFEAAGPLTGLVDCTEEAARLQKSIDKHTAEHDKSAKKLSTENFVARAPEHVVAKDRARVAELQTMLTQMNESLDRVKEMAQG